MSPWRRVGIASALSIALMMSALAPLALADSVPKTFSFTGAGYGHGVGMSQVGARGMALEGKSAAEIIQHFYTGVDVTPFPDSSSLRVNIGHLLTKFSFRVEAIAGETGTVFAQLWGSDLSAIPSIVDTPTAQVAAGVQITATPTESGTVLTYVRPGNAATPLAPALTFTVRWSGTRFLDGPAGLVNTNSNKYRYGQIHFTTIKTKDGPRLEVTNDVRLHDEYLKGIGEMPSSWPGAALQAQVIAIRSYALSKNGVFRTECDCEIYGSTKDLAFVGYSKEIEAGWGSKWVDAVTATSTDASSGLAVTLRGRPVATYFFTSSGGHTQDVIDVWGSNLTWLQAVPDPWSLDLSLNPGYATWTKAKSQADMAKAFVLSDVASYSFNSRTRGGGVKSVIATSSSGKRATLSGEIFRSRLDLPSTFIQRPVVSISNAEDVLLSIAIGKALFPSAKSAVLTTVDTETASAITAAPFAFQLKAPLLVSSGADVDTRVVAELIRRKITKVYVVGSDFQFSAKYFSELKKRKITVERLGGANRYAVAEAVAGAMKGAPILVSNQDVSSLLPLASALATASRPILWTASGVIPRQTARVLARTKSPISLIGKADHFEESLVAQLPDDFEDLRSFDEAGLAVAVEELSIPYVRVAVSSEASTSTLGFFGPQVQLLELNDYLDAHPETLIIYAIRLKSDEVSQIRALS